MAEEKKANAVEKNDGISLREIMRVIGKKIWYALAGAFVATIGSVLVFTFLFNPVRREISMSFKIGYPMSTESKYPDGSTFNYRDVLLKEVVEAAKNNPEYKDEFASVNVDKAIKEGILIFEKASLTESEAPRIYTLTLKNSCFKGVDTENFIRSLTDAFATYIEKQANNLDYSLQKDVFEKASFKNQWTLLTEQKDVLIKQYDNWIKEFSAGYVVLGKSLSNYRMEIEAMLGDNVKTPIDNDLSFKGFEYFNSAAVTAENGAITGETVKLRVKQLYEELEFDRAALAELRKYYLEGTSPAPYDAPATYAAAETNPDTSSGGSTIIITGGDSNLSQRIAYYSERVTVVDQQISYLTKKMTDITIDKIENHDFTDMAKEIKIFSNKLTEQFTSLNKSADDLKRVIGAIYKENTLVTFESREASLAGGTNLTIVAIGTFVLTFFAFAAMFYLVGRRNKKAKDTSAVESD